MAAARVPQVPPVDLLRVARYLGVEAIREAAMVEDGRLEQIGGCSRVYVRSGTVPSRRRFTIAHELAHIVLAGREAELIAHRSATAVDPEERFCNQFAAALLIPRGWLLENAPSGDESLAIARKVSRLTRTSLAATVVRLRDVLGWRSSLLQWRRIDGVWRLASTVGLPPRVHNRVTSTPHTRVALTAPQVGKDRRVAIPLAVAGRPALARGELWMRASSAALLCSLD